MINLERGERLSFNNEVGRVRFGLRLINVYALHFLPSSKFIYFFFLVSLPLFELQCVLAQCSINHIRKSLGQLSIPFRIINMIRVLHTIIAICAGEKILKSKKKTLRNDGNSIWWCSPRKLTIINLIFKCSFFFFFDKLLFVSPIEHGLFRLIYWLNETWISFTLESMFKLASWISISIFHVDVSSHNCYGQCAEWQIEQKDCSEKIRR